MVVVGRHRATVVVSFGCQVFAGYRLFGMTWVAFVFNVNLR